MQLPQMTTGAETLVSEFGLYHLTRLRADKGLKEMADGFEKSQANLRTRVEAHKAAQASTMTAMAVRDGADAALDDAVRTFALAVLQRANNNRKSPFYLNYFPAGWSSVVTAPLETELQRVGVLLSKLAEEKDATLAASGGPIHAAVDALVTAMDAHKAALDAELQAYGLVQMEKINWFDAYKLNYRALTHQFYQDPKKADTFFKPAAKGKKSAPAGASQVATA